MSLLENAHVDKSSMNNIAEQEFALTQFSSQADIAAEQVLPTNIGRYQIIAALGSGNMGTVYHALDSLIGRAVALKVIDRDRLCNSDIHFDELFCAEVQAIGRLTHPNIVTIYDAELGDNKAYFAMEYIKGQTLKELLDSGIQLPIDRVREIIHQTAEGLHHAHQHGIVHRDIKPANIMLSLDGSVKIMDFGIAISAASDATPSSTLAGTPFYMSPEQFLAGALDQRVDIYALGAVLYELLTGTQAFKASDIDSLREKIIGQEPIPPSKLNHNLNRNFDRIIARAMHKSPEARYQQVRELALDVMHAGKSELNWSKIQYSFQALPVNQMIIRLKKTVWLFNGLRTDEIVEFLQQADKTVAFPGQQIIREGRPGEFVYILLSGHVHVTKQTNDNSKPHILATLEPGQTFGEMSLVEQSACSATVSALEECTLLRVSQADFWKMPEVSAKLYKNIAALLSSRLRHSNELLSIDMGRE